MSDTATQGYSDMPGLYARRGTGKDTFLSAAHAALLKLKSKDRGKRLIELICTLCAERKVQIIIEAASGFDGQTGPGWSEADNLVRWNTENQPNQPGDEDQLNGIPTFIILGHELVHALHSLMGSTKYTDNFSDDKAIEECRTIGIGPWSVEPLTENGLRDEWKLRKRETFSGSTPARLLKGTKYADL